MNKKVSVLLLIMIQLILFIFRYYTSKKMDIGLTKKEILSTVFVNISLLVLIYFANVE